MADFRAASFTIAVLFLGIGVRSSLAFNGHDAQPKFKPTDAVAQLGPHPPASSHKPLISGVTVGAITPTSARISWITDIPADTMVFWSGSTDDYIGYGQRSAVIDSATGVTSHSVTLTNLLPGTSYWYGVRSREVTHGHPDNDRASLWEGDQRINKFKTEPAPSTGVLDYVAYLYGPHHVMQGYTMFIGTRAAMLAGTGALKVGSYKVVVSGLPPHTAVHWPLREIVGQGSVSTTHTRGDTISIWSPQHVDIGLATNVDGGITPAGSYKLMVTLTTRKVDGAAGPTKTLEWNVKVDSATPLRSHEPASYPPIPNKDIWHRNMLTYGAKWCGQAGAPYSQYVWYYDGIRVFQQIRDFTGDAARWTPCLNSVLADYRNSYVLPHGGNILLFRHFARGLYQNYTETGSADSAKAVLEMGKFADSFVSTSYMRESAYALDTLRLSAKLGGNTPKIALGVSHLVGMAEQVRDNTAPWYQPFMCGLLSEALISYYEDGHQNDIRIPYAVKGLADALWANAWCPEQQSFFYNSFRASVGFSDDGNVYLNQLIAPMYAWLFRYTGDPKYQVEGDAIWNGAVLAKPAGGIAWSGKNFSQNYRWSFDYVRWRSGR